MDNLEAKTRTECGYAAMADVTTHKLEDDMPSYLLSETFKYLYLIFDDDNLIHTSKQDYIFTTEAHPLKHLPPLPPLPPVAASTSRFFGGDSTKQRLEKEFRDDIIKTTSAQAKKKKEDPSASSATEAWSAHIGRTYPGTRLPSEGCFNYFAPELWRLHLLAPLEYQQGYKHYVPLDPDGSGAAAAAETKAAAAAALDEQKKSGVHGGSCPVDNGKSGGKKRKNSGSGGGGSSGSNGSSGSSKKKNSPARRSGHSGSSSSSPSERPPIPTTTKFFMEGFGDFLVTSFTDGFMVEHAATMESIEVANVGKIIQTDPEEYVMVHASSFNHEEQKMEVRTTVADLEGSSYDCAVEVFEHPDDGHPVISFPCTTAAFGPTTLNNLKKREFSLTNFAPLMPPPSKNEHGCKSPAGGNGGIQMVRRGDCTFEEKVLNMGTVVAAAIVVNNEDGQRFIMASGESSGKSSGGEDGVEEALKKKEARESKKRDLRAAVMISRDDGVELEKFAKNHKMCKVNLALQDNSKIFIESDNGPDEMGLLFTSLLPFPEGGDGPDAGPKKRGGDEEEDEGEGEDEENKTRWPVVQTEHMAIQVLSKDRSWGVRMVRLKPGEEHLVGDEEPLWTLYIIKTD